MAVQSAQQLSMDPAAQGSFIKFFRSLSEKPPTTVRIFDRNDYYTVHGEDAIFTANEVFHSSSVIKLLGSGTSQLPSVILSKSNFESFVRDLLLMKQYRVEIYASKVKSSNDWKVKYKASPGNLLQLEDVLFGSNDMSSSLTILAVKLSSESGQRTLGVAYTDPSSEVFGVTEFVENDQFSNLEALLVQLRPKECLVVSGDSHSDAHKLVQVIERSGVLVSERKRSEFSGADIVQDLDRLLLLQSGESASSLAQVDLKHSMGALAALIKYLNLLSDDANFGVYSLSTYDFSQYLHLDSAAVQALHVEAQGGDSPTCHLYGILNHCRSPQGQRLLQHWLRQPLLDKNKIEERLDLVEALLSDLSLRRTLQDCLKIVPDYFRLSKKINRGKGSLQDCVRVYQSLCKLPAIITALSSHDGPNSKLLDGVFVVPLQEAYDDFSKYIEMVDATIDMNLSDNHEYVIKPSFDKELLDLREQMDNLESKIRLEFKKAAKDLELEVNKGIKLEFTSQLGYFFRITKKSEKCLRSRKGYRIVEAHKDGVKFNTGALEGLNEDYLSLRRNYTATQDSLVKEVLRIASTFTEPMLSLNHILAQLDVLVSFAHASAIAPLPYVRPTILPKGEGDIVLKGCRHPCLELQDDVSFISNDVSLLRSTERFLIITGPNMGGKSTYMRQVGVTVLLAQVGCFVPCTSASLCIVDSILARVGAGDSQLKGVSTFMAEMLETSSILKSATKDSLVIIDELGRGTSTYDGFGLAWAISEYIATEIGCFCLFATHFHELTFLADEIPQVKNLHVTALTSSDSLTLLYQVMPGACDRSFGLHVAELAQFPQHVIEFAKKKVKELEIWSSPSLEGSDEDPEPQAKRRKVESEEGEKAIATFLLAVRELASSESSDSDIASRLEGLKLELLNLDNAYIKSILNISS